MQIERLIKEQIYLVKRRGRYKSARRGPSLNLNNRKFWGMICIFIGLVLVLSRCTRGSSKAKNEAVIGGQDILKNERILNTQEEHYDDSQKDYTAYFQDFNIDETRLVKLHQMAIKYKKPFADTLSIWLVESYKGTKERQIIKQIKTSQGFNILPEANLYENTSRLCSQVIYDLGCFPLSKKESYAFVNSWKEPRSYQGNRLHYGIDILDPKNEPGKIKVFSMTDGTVENVGWNELGGYRVGIRSNGGAYFYYAHLHQNPSHIQKGDTVFAGDYIGDMGNTGYGEEGTRGKFPVHLHLGIALKTQDNKEFWINPYYLLKYLELKDFVYKSL